MSESSIVALAVSIVGIIATGLTAWFTAKMALRTDIERATILRFVEMFEETIQGLTVCIDNYAHLLALCGTPLSEQNFLLRIQAFLEFHKTYSETAKSTDLAMLRLEIYFPDQKNELFDLRKLMAAEMALSDWVVKTAKRMGSERWTIAADKELFEYRQLENSFVESLKRTQVFLVSRREYSIHCYATWRKKNLSYIKDVCPSMFRLSVWERVVASLKMLFEKSV